MNGTLAYDIDELKDEVKEKLDKEEEKECFRTRMLQKGISLNVVDINVNFFRLKFCDSEDLKNKINFKIIGNAGTITLEDTETFEQHKEVFNIFKIELY